MQKRFDRPLKAFPTITLGDGVTTKEKELILSFIMISGAMSVHNAYQIRGETYADTVRDEVEEIIVSSKPIDGVPEQDSLIDSYGLHACFVGPKGKRGVMSVDTFSVDNFIHGTLHQDDKGRGWFEHSGTGELQPTSLETYDFISSNFFGGHNMTDLLPISGHFLIVGERVLGHKRDLAPGNELPQKLVEWLLFEDDAHKIVRGTFTKEAYFKLLDTVIFPTKGGLYPDHGTPERNGFDDAMAELVTSVMRGFLEAGHLEKCPNNGPRGVSCLKAWNAFIDGRDDDYYPFQLMSSPAFDAIRGTISMFFIQRKNEEEGMTRIEAEHFYEELRSDICEIMANGESFGLMSDTLRGGLSREPYSLAGSFYKPVLTTFLDPEKKPLPSLEEPKSIRHYTLNLPSGRLAMADWFRIPGFAESIEKIAGEKDAGYEINYADGLNQRAHDYLTKAGIAIVQVGNSSPRAFHHNGVWAMGHVDEDSYYDDDGEPIGDGEPEPVWETCTDLWANTFASPEAIVKVLMTSGGYETEEEAEEALTKYCNERWGANIVDLGVNTIHVYAPTGYQENKYSHINHIDFSNILSQHEMCELQYLISVHELDIDPNLISDERWEAPLINMRDETPQP